MKKNKNNFEYPGHLIWLNGSQTFYLRNQEIKIHNSSVIFISLNT